MADAAALWQQGQQAIRARRFDEARERFEQLLQQLPAHFGARLLLASVHMAQGHPRPAAAELLAATRALPGDPAAILRLAQALRPLGESNATRALLDHPLLARSGDPRVLLAAAQLQQQLGEHAQALALLDRALARDPDHPDIRYSRAVQLQFHGRLAEAEAELERCLRVRPAFGRACLMLARLRRATPGRNQLESIAQQQAQAARGSEDAAAFEFARYGELEALGRDGEAWDALVRGNALMQARLRDAAARFDEDALLDAIIAKATPEFLGAAADPAPSPTPGQPAPIFIVGMPRSGSTLLETRLARHPGIASAGELEEFHRLWRQLADAPGQAIADPHLLGAAVDFAEVGRRYLEQTRWRARGRAWYIDKLPPNFWIAGFIHKALPQARILHMAREPMELCFSNWRAMFGDSYPYSYEQGALAAHHARYRKVMRHWHDAMPGVVHEVDYAALVAEPEATLRTTLAHLGLEFDPAVLDERVDAGPSATLSSAQVRAPLSAHHRRDWLRYEAQLQPLRTLLEGE